MIKGSEDACAISSTEKPDAMLSVFDRSAVAKKVSVHRILGIPSGAPKSTALPARDTSMLREKEAELAAKSLDGTLTSDEARVREYKAHADQLGVRVKKADEEIARLKANALLKEVEI